MDQRVSTKLTLACQMADLVCSSTLVRSGISQASAGCSKLQNKLSPTGIPSDRRRGTCRSGSLASETDANSVALTGEDAALLGEHAAPTVKGSELPALLGLRSLNRKRAILDLVDNKTGPGTYDLSKAMPPGTQTYQLKVAPSGHLLLPCAEWSANLQTKDTDMHLHVGASLAAAASSS